MAKNTTTYTVVLDGANTDIVRSKKESAVNQARTLLADRKGYRVQVVTGAGTVVFEAARRKITKFTKPFTKVVDLPEDIAALVPEGYAAAYTRPRNGAVVLRMEDPEVVEDPSLYAVLDTVAKTIADFAATTRDAGQIMKSLGKSRKVAASA